MSRGLALPRVLVLLVGVLGSTSATFAQFPPVSTATTPPPAPARSGPTLSDPSTGLGSAIRWPLFGPLSAEVEVGYRRTNISPYHANVMLAVTLPRIGRAEPYVSGGIGLDHFPPPDQPFSNLVVRIGPPYSLTTATGVRIPIDGDRLYRAELRLNRGLGARAPEMWRLYNGITIGGRR